jgi:N-acetylmuramoyl-L-alanine amidase
VIVAVARGSRGVVSPDAQSTDAGSLYKQALRREAVLRQELDAAGAGAPAGLVLERIRVLVGSYEDLSRLFASTEYGDDALSQGGNLAADAFARFGEAADRTTALRLLNALTREFPSSALSRQASARARTLEQARPAAGVKLPEESVQVRTLDEPKIAPRMKGPTPDEIRPSTPPPPRPSTPSPMPAPVTPATGTTVAPAIGATVTPPTGATVAPAIGTTVVPATGTTVTLRAIRREVLPETLRITLELDREVAYYDERIEGPPRVFVDLPNTRAAETIKDATIPFPDGAVKQVRVGRQLNSRTRVVLDLNGAGSHSVYALYNPYRVVIDFERTPAPPPQPIKASVLPLPPARSSVSVVPSKPSSVSVLPSKTIALLRAPARAPTVLTSNVSRSARLAVSTASPTTRVATGTTPAGETSSPGAGPAPATPRNNARGGYSLARQLGLGATRIVIDPGHGGHDPGARVNGISEASLVLDVAMRLEELLKNQPGVEVVLTRRSDTYIALEERTAIANRSDADLFLSIHANASTAATARGIETYFLNFATNPEAEAIAARENAGSAKTMRHLPDIVQAIAMNNKIDESRDLATIIQSTLYDQLRKSNRNLKNLGVKQAPFVVLVGATMPSALAEVSFMTNRNEAALLKTDKYRQQIAEALHRGITRYQGSLKTVVARSE